MDLPVIQRRYYGVYELSNDQTTNSNLTSIEENNKYIVIHISIIFSVIIFIVVVGVILCLYRRRLRRSKSHTANLNRVINITHLTNTDDIILDYYSNSHDYNKSSSENKIISTQLETVQENENESELSPPSSPTQSLTRENRNYFIYAKSSDIISENNNDINNEISDTNNVEVKSDKNNDEAIKLRLDDETNKLKLDKNNDETIKLKLGKNNEIIKLKSDNNESTNTLNNSIKRHNSKKRTKVNFNLISGPITSPSDSIYNNEKADSLSRTTTRVIPPIPPFSSNKYIRQKEILRGPEMAEYYLTRQFSDASAATIDTDATIAIDTASNDNPIMEITKRNNKIITTDEAVLDMIPINGYDGSSNLKNSY